jgi:hypothetical protein
MCSKLYLHSGIGSTTALFLHCSLVTKRNTHARFHAYGKHLPCAPNKLVGCSKFWKDKENVPLNLKKKVLKLYQHLLLDHSQNSEWLKSMQQIPVPGFDSQRGLGIYLFTTVSRTALGPAQPPIQWVPGALSLEVKRPGRGADHSPPSSAEVNNAWSYTSTSPISLHGVVLS